MPEIDDKVRFLSSVLDTSPLVGTVEAVNYLNKTLRVSFYHEETGHLEVVEDLPSMYVVVIGRGDDDE